MMPLARDEHGIWTLEIDETEQDITEQSHPSYIDAIPRYLTAFDVAFERAREASEFNFIWSILALRGMMDAGWNPYETTVAAITSVRNVAKEVEGDAAQHLALWLYGHIMEASEPYEFLSNLIGVSAGGRFNVERFPPRRTGVPLSPQIKISQLEEQAAEAGIREVVIPMRESWNRDFRNAIFHADYALHGPEVRTIRPAHIYSHDDTMTLVNRALAYHEAMTILRKRHIESYDESVRIPSDPVFTHGVEEQAVVIVRQGYGLTGLKDGWTEEELARGRIPYRMGIFTGEEAAMLDAAPTRSLLPARD